jgi:hypothetical protein
MKKIFAALALAVVGLAVFAQDITLPAPKSKIGLDLADAIKARSTSRTFVAKDIPAEDLSTVLWAANGLKGPDAVSSATKAGRTIAYSGDNAYLDVYVFTAKGAYLYDPDKNLLKQVAKGELRDKVTVEFIKTSPALVLFALDTAKLPSFAKGGFGDALGTGTAGAAAESASLAASGLKLSTIIMYNINAKTISSIGVFSATEKPISFIQMGYAQ